MFETDSPNDAPRIRQLSIMLENRIGALQRVLGHLEREVVQIRAITILEAADHAVVRVVVDHPDIAVSALRIHGFDPIETDLLGVAIQVDQKFAIRRVLSALLSAEVNVSYLYPLSYPVKNKSILAIHVENMDHAAWVLCQSGFRLIGQEDLSEEGF
ncbi:MAG: hypothetical protein RL885_27365 [Planctomycetota bacterium]